MTTGTLFWDVDTQADFMKADGRLYVPGSDEIVPTLARLTGFAHENGIRILASADDHTAADPEISPAPDWQATFPEHCMRGTAGQRKIPETALRNPLVIEPEPADPAALQRQILGHDGDLLFHKHHVDVFTNPNLLPALEVLVPQRVVLYGVALDVCDRHAVEGILRHRPGIRLELVTDATRPIDPARGDALLRDWEARGVVLTTADQVLGG